MSNTLPKEKQTAYQRWEMASFGDDRPNRSQHQGGNVTNSSEQLVSLRQKAREEGHAAGLAEGRQKGLQEGRARAAEEVAKFTRVATKFQQDISQANELIANDMLDVSLDLAKAMLHTALKIRPELILPIVNEAVHYLPSVQAPASLFLHPEDIKIVKQFMGDELSKTGWRVLEDPQIQRGGCRVETASNQIDATASTRWQRITAALGKSDEWLEK
ncbi:MAG: flagellar assembly protein FliH [Oxalobacter sp.]|nr:MAG: flagellar assembly protein FliH [Oxalobacter sp.]